MSSGEHSIIYELRVNGVPLSSYKYTKTLSRAHNVWVRDNTHGLGNDGVKWPQSTVGLFLREAAADPKIAELRAELDYYFSSEKQ